MDRSSSPGPAAAGSDPPLTVLIVDDDPSIRLLLQTMLELDGFEVVGMAEDGNEAVPMAFDTQPDVIVLDYMMPKIDGAESAKFLRAAAPHSMIIAFSGIVHSKPEWADDFVSKAGVDGLAEMARYLTGQKRLETERDHAVPV